MSRTALNYAGSVVIRYRIKDKVVESKYHNNGLPNLFRVISKALTGVDVSNEKPTSIDLRSSNDGSTWTSCIGSGGIATGVYFTQETPVAPQTVGDWVTKATTTLSYTQLIDTSFSDEYYRLYLVSNTADLAFLDVEKSGLSNLTQGTQAIIEWTLKVSNSTESTNNS